VTDVRPADGSDADRLFPLVEGFATSFVPDRRAVERSLATLADDPSALAAVAEDDGEPTGYEVSATYLRKFLPRTGA
jgi:hypothetical protein